MKRLFVSFLLLMFTTIALIIGYLSIVGHETERFNTLLEKKITSNIPNSEISLNTIKIKINIRNLNFFVTTSKPIVKYYNKEINLKKINAYINFKSLILGNPKIKEINVLSDEIEIQEIKDIVKYFKPSSFKKFFLNDIKKGEMNFNLDLELKDNKIKNYEVNGFVKNFFARNNNFSLEKTSFIYMFKEKGGEIDNLRGLINSFQISSGNIEFDNSKMLKIKGNLKSDVNLEKNQIINLIGEKILSNVKNFNISGKINSSFEINFDETLKIINYKTDSNGDIDKSEIDLKKPQKYLFVENKIENINLEKIKFKIQFSKNKKNSIDINGSYKLNNNTFQKFELKDSFENNFQKLSVKADFDNNIVMPFLNFNTEDKIASLSTNLELSKNLIKIKRFTLKEGKNKIDITNLFFKNKRLTNLEELLVKTFIDEKLNNDFKVIFDKKIKITGKKYDASNLTKLLDKKDNSNIFKGINKEISMNIKEISTSVSDVLFNFNLIGFLENGKFNKIISKGEFKDGKYLDIALKKDTVSNQKILEIYSDLPKPLLSNYKFFKGLTGGQLLLSSSYDNNKSKSNLIIENFKVKEAPGLMKLLSLADFGGMVDAVSGDGLSFEKLEMTMNKNDKVLNLTELYAIGPSISILMEGYVESETGLVSLRGTMVPAKTLNNFLSKLPIVGEILIPKEIGEGLFGISFKMKGTPGKIKTTVNPIKTLTPRFIQKALKKPK